MGRENRIIDPGSVYHAGSRGNNRGRIAWDREDYETLADLLARTARRHGWRVLAWCLMPNHYHVVPRMPRDGFSVGFQQINGTYSRRTNRRYGRSDHLWKNRPWSFELTSPAHEVASILYVNRNPVEAGLCARAHEWVYSSYRATMGLERAPSWLAVEETLELFGRDVTEARRVFAALVHAGHVPLSDIIAEVISLERGVTEDDVAA